MSYRSSGHSAASSAPYRADPERLSTPTVGGATPARNPALGASEPHRYRRPLRCCTFPGGRPLTVVPLRAGPSAVKQRDYRATRLPRSDHWSVRPNDSCRQFVTVHLKAVSPSAHHQIISRLSDQYVRAGRGRSYADPAETIAISRSSQLQNREHPAERGRGDVGTVSDGGDLAWPSWHHCPQELLSDL